jgi:hypothetical protein
MRVINLWSGPCAGKSTTAAGLFYEMKKRGIEVELVTEYAKDLVWENRHNILEDQIYVFAKQQRRIARLKDHHIDWVITDSPIPLGLCYTKPGLLGNNFASLVLEVFDRYQNHNFFLTRRVPFNPVGRNQKTEQDALHLDEKILQLLNDHEISYEMVDGGEAAIPQILKHVGIL